MRTKKLLLTAGVLAALMTGCDSSPERAANERDHIPQSGTAQEPRQFDGVWEVVGRTGNEDGSNEPVCGHETGLGSVTIEGSKITGNVTNKSGFEYTVEGTIEPSGNIKAMLIYSGYDAAELFGTFNAETNSAKGHWKDAVNACPGVWQATRTATSPAKTEEVPQRAPGDKALSGKSG